MPINLKHIAQGWINVLWDELGFLDEDIKEMSIRRLEICHGCKVRWHRICSNDQSDKAVIDFDYYGRKRKKGIEYTGCGCPLTSKTKVEDEICPVGKWLDVERDKKTGKFLLQKYLNKYRNENKNT